MREMTSGFFLERGIVGAARVGAAVCPAGVAGDRTRR